MTFDVFIRLKLNSPDPLFDTQPGQQAPIESITAWHGTPAALFAEMARGTASHVVFLDAPLQEKPFIWDLIPRINTALGGEVPFTINCPALEAVYGVEPGATETSRWPVWLLVLPRTLFAQLPSDKCDYHTLEFALLEFASLSAIPVRIVGEAIDLFDPMEWASKLVLQHKETLAGDYQKYRERNRAAELVPPQFRVETHYRTVSLEAFPPATATPRLSVICPVFKSSFIRQLVDSVCRQTYAHWELRLGIDGPPPEELDRITDQLATFNDPRIVTFIQENRGTGPTRQRLAQEATGDFVVTIDDDDMLMPDALMLFARAIAGTPGGQVFRGGARLVGLTDLRMPQNKRFLINGIANDPFEATQPYAIDRQLLLSMGGYEWDASIYNAGEDTMLFHRLDQRGIPVYLIPEVIYLRRLSTQNLTLFFQPEDALGHFRNLDAHFCPAGWENRKRRFDLDQPGTKGQLKGVQLSGHFQRAIAEYRHHSAAGAVVTATRFYQYQTLGDLKDFVIDLALSDQASPPYRERGPVGAGEDSKGLSITTVHEIAAALADGPRRTIVLCGSVDSGLPHDLIGMIGILQGAGQRVVLHLDGTPDPEIREALSGVHIRHYQVQSISPGQVAAPAEEANVCPIAKSRIYVAHNGEMLLCGMSRASDASRGRIAGKDLEQMHFDTLLDYVRGQYRTVCAGCAFCPEL